MPFGAVFTSSSGGDIGGGRLRTRFRGPILAGYASTADPGGQTLVAAGGAVAGSAAQPMYSFYTRPDMGFYGATVTTGAPDMRFSQTGIDYLSFSSVGTRLASTAAAGATALPDFAWASTVGALSTAAQTGYMYCPGTSQTPVGSGPPIPLFVATSGSNVTYAVPFTFDVTNKKLWFYTTASSWIGLGASTSGATFWTTSS